MTRPALPRTPDRCATWLPLHVRAPAAVTLDLLADLPHRPRRARRLSPWRWRPQHLLLPSVAPGRAVPTCTFPRAVFARPDVADTAQRWRDRGAGFLVGLALVGLAWWGWA
jgi:hypothetical protein